MSGIGRAWAIFAACALSLGAGGAPAAVGLAGMDWEVAFDAAGFRLAGERTGADGLSKKSVFEHPDRRRKVNVVIFPAEPEDTAASVRDDRWSRIRSAPPREVKTRVWEEEDRASFSYFLEFFVRGSPFHQRNVHTFFVHGGSRIEVHVSIVRFGGPDEAWLDAFQESLRVRARREAPSVAPDEGSSDRDPAGSRGTRTGPGP